MVKKDILRKKNKNFGLFPDFSEMRLVSLKHLNTKKKAHNNKSLVPPAKSNSADCLPLIKVNRLCPHLLPRLPTPALPSPSAAWPSWRRLTTAAVGPAGSGLLLHSQEAELAPDPSDQGSQLSLFRVGWARSSSLAFANLCTN
jgi:hypothetical protein